MYVELGTDTAGYAITTGVALHINRLEAGKTYMLAKVGSIEVLDSMRIEQRVNIELPDLNKYYLQEDLALKADKVIVSRSFLEAHEVYALVNV